MSKRVCQCKNGSYSKDCCDDYLAQGIGELDNQSEGFITNENTIRTRVRVRNATDI